MSKDEYNLSNKYYLSNYRRDDAPQIVESLSNEKIARNLRTVPIPYKFSDALEWLDRLEEEQKNPETAPLRWAIRETVTHKLIGDISLRPSDEEAFTLGYWLAIEYWGLGIMTDAVATVLATVKGGERVKLVLAGAKEGNWASRRVLEKNGFRMVGLHEENESDIPNPFWDFELSL